MYLNTIIKTSIFALAITNTIGNVSFANVYQASVQIPGVLYNSFTPSSADVTFTTNNNDIGQPETPSSATATVSISPMPYVFAKSSININPSLGGSSGGFANALITYSYNVNGTPNSVVPLNFTSAYKLTSSNTFNSAGFSLVQFGLFTANDFAGFSLYCQLDSCDQQSQSLNNVQLSLDGSLLDGPSTQTTVPFVYGLEFDEFFKQGLLSGIALLMLDESGNSSGYVSIQTQTRALGIVSTVTGFIDPYFFIDSAYLDENPNTSLSFTPGVGNAPPNISAVPVPAALPLMASALGIFGIARRRNKPKAQ